MSNLQAKKPTYIKSLNPPWIKIKGGLIGHMIFSKTCFLKTLKENGYVPCDGKIIKDPESPLKGQRTPSISSLNSSKERKGGNGN